MRLLSLAALSLAFLWPARARAQLLLAERAAPDHRVSLSFGWESTWLARLGYARGLGGSPAASVDVALSLPVFALPGGGRLEAGYSSLLSTGAGMGLGAGARSGLLWSSDPLGTRVSWTGALLLAPGWFADRWHIAADLGWRVALATWMSHSDVVRELYQDRATGPGSVTAPRSGLFGLTSQRASLGLRGGWGAASGVGFVARGGLDLAPQRQGIIGNPPIFTLPFYAEMGGDFRWLPRDGLPGSFSPQRRS